MYNLMLYIYIYNLYSLFLFASHKFQSKAFNVLVYKIIHSTILELAKYFCPSKNSFIMIMK